jgi:hypothetical protein
MAHWTLVYRVHHRTLSSRQRRVVSYRDATEAYNALLTVQREAWYVSGAVSRAYLISPEGQKMPLVSPAPPHHAIARELFTRVVTQRPPDSADPLPVPHFPVDRAIFEWRLLRVFVQVGAVSPTTATILAYINLALFEGSEKGLVALCQQVLEPWVAPPHPGPPDRERLLRHLRGLTKQAEAGFPGAAPVLTYLEQAFSRGTEDFVLQACRTFFKLPLATRQEAGPGTVFALARSPLSPSGERRSRTATKDRRPDNAAGDGTAAVLTETEGAPALRSRHGRSARGGPRQTREPSR